MRRGEMVLLHYMFMLKMATMKWWQSSWEEMLTLIQRIKYGIIGCLLHILIDYVIGLLCSFASPLNHRLPTFPAWCNCTDEGIATRPCGSGTDFDLWTGCTWFQESCEYTAWYRSIKLNCRYFSSSLLSHDCLVNLTCNEQFANLQCIYIFGLVSSMYTTPRKVKLFMSFLIVY